MTKDHSACGKKDKCDCTGTPDQKACADCDGNLCDACAKAEYPNLWANQEKLVQALEQFEADEDLFDDNDD